MNIMRCILLPSGSHVRHLQRRLTSEISPVRNFCISTLHPLPSSQVDQWATLPLLTEVVCGILLPGCFQEKPESQEWFVFVCLGWSHGPRLFLSLFPSYSVVLTLMPTLSFREARSSDCRMHTEVNSPSSPFPRIPNIQS